MFATGAAATATEYTLATLASYLLGNAILQWTMVISLMLFAMGVGSRFSRRLIDHLMDYYVLTELGLSLFCALSALICFWASAFTTHSGTAVYFSACAVGFLIGLEVPLVARINERFETLRINISSVMEYDYYGALAGGALFGFFFLPVLGLTYTPMVLGGMNWLAGGLILFPFASLTKRPVLLKLAYFGIGGLILLAAYFAKPIILYGEQHKYKDKIVYEEQTQYQKIVVTQWKENYWLFLNGSEQFSTYDEERYHEPLVHPALSLLKERKDILLLGGGDGLAAREILKYADVETLTVVDLDPAMTRLAREHPIFKTINKGALDDPRTKVISQDAYQFIENAEQLYDAVIVDLPDPKTVSLSLLYSQGFYTRVYQHLKPYGVVVTQSGSPLYSPDAFVCIKKTMEAGGFTIVPFQNSVPTLGRWGWNIGVKKERMTAKELKDRLNQLEFAGLETRFINRDAMISMTHFGKGLFEREAGIEVNTRINHVLTTYYRQGDWDLY